MPSSGFRSHPAPVQDYAAAVEKVQAIQARETATPGFNSRLQTILMSHGRKTGRAVLWFHGYTATTLQFKPLAELCFQKGYNVLIPCVPHHGMQDRLSAEVSKIDARELVHFSDEMTDLARGLGEELIVGGLSMGGVQTAWVAQERADVAMAIIIAPFLGARIIPTPLTGMAALAFRLLPDILQWWDPEKKEHLDGPAYTYPRYSTHSLGQILGLGFQTFALARRKPPAAGKVWVVINDHDESVNNAMVQRLVDTWQRSNAGNVQTFHFADELGIPHDCISIEQPTAKTPIVYGELMRMVG